MGEKYGSLDSSNAVVGRGQILGEGRFKIDSTVKRDERKPL